MDFLLELAWKNAAVALVLALAAAAAGRWFRRPALAHALWLLVLIKLVTPPLWHVSVPWPVHEAAHARVEDSFGPGYSYSPPHEEAQVPKSVTSSSPSGSVENRPMEAAVDLTPVQMLPTPGLVTSTSSQDAQSTLRSEVPLPDEPRVISWITWQQGLVGVWALGSCAWLVLLLARLRQFKRLVLLATPAGAAESLRVAELARTVGLKRPPTLRFLSACVPPMTWGFGGGHELLVPADLWNSLTATQRDALILHELAHLRRGDHWVRHFELFVFVLHWWHPVSWWARHELQEAEEECCDAWVVRALPDSAGDYADLIVETVAYLSQRRNPALPPLATGLGQIKHVRKRLSAILKGPGSPRLSVLCWLTLLLVGCGLLPLIPTSAEELARGRASPGLSLGEGAGRVTDGIPLLGLAGMAPGTEENQPEASTDPLEENLALLRIQLVQKEADLAEAKSLLDRAAKRANRGTESLSKGKTTLELIEPSLTDQKIQEARVRGCEANVQEFELRIKQEESRLNNFRKARQKAATAAAGAVASAARPDAPQNPEPDRNRSTPEISPVQKRLDQMEKRLDTLFAEAMALEAELKNARAQEK